MISQTETVKISMSAAKAKMGKDLADKTDIHVLRRVSGNVSWLAGQTRQVARLQHTLPQQTIAQVCACSMVVRRVPQHGSQDQANSRAKHDIVVACRRLVEPLVVLSAHKTDTSVVLPISHCWMERIAPWSPLAWDHQKRVAQCRPGIRRMGNAVSAESDSPRSTCVVCSSCNARKALVCVKYCKSLYNHLLTIGSSTTLQNKRSRCTHVSRALEEDGLCDTLGTYLLAIG